MNLSKFLFVVVLMFCLVNVSAFDINQFNDSSTEGNMSFLNGNNTRWLNISNGNFITNGFVTVNRGSFTTLINSVDTTETVFNAGVTANATWIWLLDSVAFQVYKFFPNLTFSGENWSTSSSGNGDPKSLTTNGSSMWITDDTDNLIYEYQVNGTLIKTFSTVFTSPLGVTTNNSFIWVVDTAAERVHQYFMNGTSTGESFLVNGETTDPSTIAIINDSIFIGARSSKVIFRYLTNGTYQGQFLIADDGSQNLDGMDFFNDSIYTVYRSNLTLYQYQGVFLPTNISLYINNTLAWNFSGTINDFIVTDNLQSSLNENYALCNPLSPFCQIPFIFQGGSGILRYLNISINNFGFVQNSVTFNNNTFETKDETFSVNISVDSSVILDVSAILNYNGTRFTAETICSGNTCLIETTIDIPLLNNGGNELRDWLFELSLFSESNTTNANTTTSTQNVSSVFLEFCNATFTTQALNFTAFNEQTLELIEPFTFSADFEFWLGTGSVLKNKSFQNSSTDSVQLCIQPATETYEINAVVEYDEASGSSFTTRNYYFQNDFISNVSQDIGLGLLFTNQSTSFILRVQDPDILPLSEALVFTERFYAGTGEFRVVQVAKTDDNGKSVGFFEVETADYRFIIKKDGVVLLITPQPNTSQKVVGEEVPFTLTFTIGDEEGAAWEDFEPVSELTSSLIYNITSQIISFTYIDTSTDFELAQLQVFQLNVSGVDILVCNNTLNQSSGIISCNMTGNSTGNYIAKGIIFRGGVRNLVEQITFTIETFTSQAGRLGLFLGWLVILISAFAFKFNEVAGIIMINITMIFINIIGLVNFGITWITAWVALSIFILVVMER